jgi:hypothetical protein
MGENDLVDRVAMSLDILYALAAGGTPHLDGAVV